MKLLLIRWRDAEQHKEAWVSEEDTAQFAQEDCFAVSIGWEVKRTKAYLTIASDQDETNKNWGCLRKIPTKTIVSEQEIAQVASSV